MARARSQGQVALVTGATRGIGRAIALALGADGATVVGTATTDDGAASIGAYLARPATRAPGIALDVTDGAAVDAALADDRGALRRHRAFSSTTPASRATTCSMRMKDDDWDAVMATNLKPAFRLCARPCCAA